MNAFGKPIHEDFLKKGENVLKNIWNLVTCSNGGLFPSEADEFLVTATADEVNRAVPTVMGFKLFYGLKDDKVIEFIRKGRVTESNMKWIRQRGVTRLWDSCFTAETWLIDGKERTTQLKVDLSPTETAQAAVRFAQAIGAI